MDYLEAQISGPDQIQEFDGPPQIDEYPGGFYEEVKVGEIYSDMQDPSIVYQEEEICNVQDVYEVQYEEIDNEASNYTIYEERLQDYEPQLQNERIILPNGTSIRRLRPAQRQPPTIAQCTYCGMIFKHPSKIQAHLRTHTGEKPFECLECGLKCSTNSALSVHIRRFHTRERPHECTWNCGMRFVSVAARNEHERIVHIGIKRYQCIVGNCRRLFTRRNYLIKHLKKDHSADLSENQDLTDCSRVVNHPPEVHPQEIRNQQQQQQVVYEVAKEDEGVFESYADEADQMTSSSYSGNFYEEGKTFEEGHFGSDEVGGTSVVYEHEEEDDDEQEELEDVHQPLYEDYQQEIDENEGEEFTDEDGDMEQGSNLLYTANSLPPSKGRKKGDQSVGNRVYVDSSVYEFAAPLTSVVQSRLRLKSFMAAPKLRENVVVADDAEEEFCDEIPSIEGCSQSTMQAEFKKIDNSINTIARGKPSTIALRYQHSSIRNNQTSTLRHRRPATMKTCEVCGKELKYPSKIEAHMRTHTNERPFKCAICGHGFAQRTTLRMHLRRHLNQKPFVCPYADCDKRFINGGLLNAHLNKSHDTSQSTRL